MLYQLSCKMADILRDPVPFLQLGIQASPTAGWKATTSLCCHESQRSRGLYMQKLETDILHRYDINKYSYHHWFRMVAKPITGESSERIARAGRVLLNLSTIPLVTNPVSNHPLACCSIVTQGNQCWHWQCRHAHICSMSRANHQLQTALMAAPISYILHARSPVARPPCKL